MANDTSLISPTNPHFFKPLLPGFQSHLIVPTKFFSEHIEEKTVKLRSDAYEKTWNVKVEGQRLTNGWKEFVEAHDLHIGDFLVFRQVVPKDFAKRNGLAKKGRQKIVLRNEEGKSWPSEIKSYVDRFVICGSWTSFCATNKLEAGDSCTFKLVQNTKTPVFRLCSRTKADRKKQSVEETVENRFVKLTPTSISLDGLGKQVTISADDNIVDKSRFVKLTPTSNSLELGKQHLPVSFTRGNGLVKPGKITLVDKKGAKWLLKLKVSNGMMYIFSGNGWRSFCAANDVGVGESLTLELIRGSESPLLKFCSKMKQPPSEPKAGTRKQARAKVEIKEKTFEEKPSHQTNPSNKNL